MPLSSGARLRAARVCPRRRTTRCAASTLERSTKRRRRCGGEPLHPTVRRMEPVGRRMPGVVNHHRYPDPTAAPQHGPLVRFASRLDDSSHQAARSPPRRARIEPDPGHRFPRGALAPECRREMRYGWAHAGRRFRTLASRGSPSLCRHLSDEAIGATAPADFHYGIHTASSLDEGDVGLDESERRRYRKAPPQAR